MPSEAAVGDPARGRAGRRSRREERRLDAGWQVAAVPAGAEVLPAPDALTWHDAVVPGTVAAALPGATDLDEQDWVFRTTFDAAPAAAGEEVVLCLDGIATVADVVLNGTPLVASTSMWEAHERDVGGLLRGTGNDLVVHCRALGPLLRVPRRPRARWRTKLCDNGLRWWRTMLLGRAPGFADGPPAVGPWRPVRLVRRSGLVAGRPRLVARAGARGGTLSVELSLRTAGGVAVDVPDMLDLVVDGPTGRHTATLRVVPAADGGHRAHGTAELPEVARWWPHTHGQPHRYAVEVRDGDDVLAAAHTGFRTLAGGPDPADCDIERDGLALHVNGVAVFARGAVWTPVDPIGLAPDPAEVRRTLERVRDAGMNLVRVVGTATYEDDVFHDICDELGLLVWQDLMFANLDVPFADEAFAALVQDEITDQLARLAGRPSFAVLCGNSETEQQVAMLGLDPALGRGELFGEVAPALLAASGADAVYVPSAPCGGTLPMRPDRGVANWFGVGGYGRPLEDARRAEVRFASECLAFANVPDAAMADRIGIDAGVPRDNGASWDFADVRDRYLTLVYAEDPLALRRDDVARYAELSRAVTGEAMAAVFGEWRRAASPCNGGIVLWLRDLEPGSGWGVLDRDGRPKLAWHHLRRALAPVAAWMTDEGLAGLRVHLANDGPRPLRARLELVLLRDGEQVVDRAGADVEIAPHTVAEHDAEGLLGRFADISYAYRFGPPAHDVVVATLRDGAEILAQAFAFPAGRPLAVQPADRVGLSGRVREAAGTAPVVEVSAQRIAYGVRVQAPGFLPTDDGFCVAPGLPRSVRLVPDGAADPASPPRVTLTALNVRGAVGAVPEDPA